MAIKDIFREVEVVKQHIDNLGIEDLKRELSDNPDLLLIDLREIQERVDLGTIPGSTHAPRGMLEFWASPASPYFRDYFQEDRRTILYCAGGGRSAFAARVMLDMGFKDVAHLEDGFTGWQEAGEDIEDVSATSRWIRRSSASA